MSTASRALLGRGGIYTLSTVLSAGSAILALPLLTRLLSIDQFGTVAFATTVGPLLALGANLALPAATTRAYFLEAGRDVTAARLTYEGTIFAAVATVVLVATPLFWLPSGFFRDFHSMAALTALYGGLLAIVQLLLALLRAQERAWSFVLVSAFSSVVAIVAGLVSCGVRSPSALVYLAGLAGAQVMAVALGLLCSGLVSVPRRPEGNYRRIALGIALPTIPHLLALQAFAVGLRLVMQADEGEAAVARFHVAYTAGSLAVVLLTAVNNAWAPLIFKAEAEERTRVVRETTQTVLGIATLTSAACALAGPWILHLLAPGAYGVGDLLPSVALVAAAGPVYAYYLAHMHLVVASARTAALAITTPVAAVLALMVAFAGSQTRWSVEVASLSVPIFYALATASGRMIASRSAGRPLPWSWMSAASAVVLVCGGVSLMLPLGLAGHLVRAGLLAACLAVSARFLSHAFGRISGRA